MSRGNLHLCSSIGMHLVPVQDVAREIDQQTHKWRSFWDPAMDYFLSLALESAELRLECPDRPLAIAVGV